MLNQPTQEPTSADPRYASIHTALKDPRIEPLVSSYSAMTWLLRKNIRRLVEEGAMVKTGKRWSVSLSRAPSVIESIYREQTLASLDR